MLIINIEYCLSCSHMALSWEHVVVESRHLRSWQCLPTYGDGQWHLKSPSRSLQVPPFRHGWPTQSFISAGRKKNNVTDQGWMKNGSLLNSNQPVCVRSQLESENHMSCFRIRPGYFLKEGLVEGSHAERSAAVGEGRPETGAGAWINKARVKDPAAPWDHVVGEHSGWWNTEQCEVSGSGWTIYFEDILQYS